ncbi:ATP-dependent DNA helicase, partial [Frankliniella fusca]
MAVSHECDKERATTPVCGITPQAPQERRVRTARSGPASRAPASPAAAAGPGGGRAQCRHRVFLHRDADKDEREEADRGDTDWETYIEYLRDLRLKLKDVLASDDCPDTVEEVWRAAGCPDDATYELAIRTGVCRPSVLYRRAVADRWTNPFLKWVLEAFLSNTDAQVILDLFSLLRYCIKYVTKEEKNHSQLHNEITRLRREQGFDDRTLMRMLSSRTLRAKETSAQEAAWVLMKFPLSETSRKCTFIDTSQPQERVHSPKPAKDLVGLPQGSTDLWYPDLYDIYSRRPDNLEQVTLAEFVALHHQSKDLKARRNHRIIRYRRFAENSENLEERENFYRAMCTLHLSWRDESEILTLGQASSFQKLYADNEDTILTRRATFEAALGLDALLQHEMDVCVAEDEAAALEAECNARGTLAGASKLCFDDEIAEFMDCDDAQDVNIDLQELQRQPQLCAVPAQVRRRGVWDRQTYLDNIRRLNKQQRDVVLAVIHETFFPANTVEDSSTVVISAPTGKAAYNIGGGTMHNVYHLSYNQEATSSQRLHGGSTDVMLPLQGQQLGNMQIKFANVRAQIIDEVSMVSDRNLLGVDQRCKEAKGSEADFGGLWTIIFGDFRQLAPVGGSPVYVSSTDSLAGSSLLWQKFEYVELSENMRQGEDKVFAELLKKIGD